VTSTAGAAAPTHEPPAHIRARDVSFSWQSRRKARVKVLDRFDLSVQTAERVGLLGPNGSGKSTAIALLSGLQRPDSGEIAWHVDGRAEPPTSPRARADFSVVFQQPSLDLQLSAYENLSLAAEMRGLPRHAPRIPALLEAMNLTERRNDRVRDFSGGMRRRLDLARSLLPSPRALLLDEPTAGLDENGFRAFWRGLESHRTSGLTIIVATHRPDEAALCDRLLLMHEGRIARHGTPAELIAELGEGLLVLSAAAPEEVAHTLREQLGLPTRIHGNHEIHSEIPPGEAGSRLLVRAIEAFPKGRIDTISLRRPTLADVFAKVTGASLHDAPPAETP
jgi:ABC-2 type transport system ATP-binding protein